MSRFFAMLRYSKKFKIITICGLIDLMLILSLIVFDFVQFIMISFNTAKLSYVFFPINIALISIIVINIISILIFIIVKKLKEKKYEQEKN